MPSMIATKVMRGVNQKPRGSLEPQRPPLFSSSTTRPATKWQSRTHQFAVPGLWQRIRGCKRGCGFGSDCVMTVEVTQPFGGRSCRAYMRAFPSLIFISFHRVA